MRSDEAVAIRATDFCTTGFCKSGFRLFTLGLILLCGVQAHAGTYQVLFEFPFNGSGPTGPLTTDGTTFYGVTRFGGTSGAGSVYSIQPDGTDYQMLRSLTGQSLPQTTLTLIDSTLVGGRLSGQGYAYALGTDGSNYQVIRNGTVSDPRPAPMVATDTQMMGYVDGSASFPSGSLFLMNADGTGFQRVHNFGTGTSNGTLSGGLTRVGDKIYGTLATGGAFLRGGIFSIDLDGSDFEIVYSAPVGGLQPDATLFEHDGKLYGVTDPIASPSVTVFSINLDGTDPTPIRSFDGSFEPNSLVVVGETIVGTDVFGRVFTMSTDGSNYQPLAIRANGALTVFNDTIYGVGPTDTSNIGVLFAMTVPEPSTLALATLGLVSVGLGMRLRARRRFPGL